MTPHEPHYRFVHAGGQVLFSLHGRMVGPSLPGLSNQLVALVADVPHGSRVIVDLSDVESCDPAACRVLARVQRRLRDRGCRTAWLAHRPRLRGLALWVVHAAGDPQAMPVTDASLANEWLASTEARLDRLEALAQTTTRRMDLAYAKRSPGSGTA